MADVFIIGFLYNPVTYLRRSDVGVRNDGQRFARFRSCSKAFRNACEKRNTNTNSLLPRMYTANHCSLRLTCDDWENIYTLSYYHHQIRSMNYYPLFRVRSWNNGVRCIHVFLSSYAIKKLTLLLSTQNTFDNACKIHAREQVMHKQVQMITSDGCA